MDFYYFALILKILALLASAMLYGSACYVKNDNRHSFDVFRQDVKITSLILLTIAGALIIL